MRVVFAIPAYLPAFAYGGPVTAISAVAEGLVARGHAVSVLTSDLLDPAGARLGLRSEVIGGVTVERARTLIHRGWAPISIDLVRILPDHLRGADVLHVCGFRDGIGGLAALFARAQGVPLVLEPLGMLRPVHRSLAKKRAFDSTFGRALLASAARVVASSRLEAAEMLDLGLARAKVALRPNAVDAPALGVDGASMRARLGVPPESLFVLFLGRVMARKGLEHLARAVARLERPVVLVVAGPDEQDGTLQRVAQILSRRPAAWKAMGPVYGLDKWSLLAAADVLGLASPYGENFGLVAAEAMAVGTPVLLSTACGAGEWVTAASGRRLPLEPAAWVDVLEALASRRLVFEPGEVKKAVEPLRVEAVVERQLEIYAELTRTDARARA